jgi:hypothetical protein
MKKDTYIVTFVEWSIQILLAVLFLYDFGPKWKTTIKLLKIQLIGIRNICPMFDYSVQSGFSTHIDEILHLQQVSGA